ncbi:MAG: exodeoxyribonuclease III [Candidatus Sericytochromatia bacterium]|nr:exodeoxyribonuclease III [Candidatus Sericytochromatia bacterium]
MRITSWNVNGLRACERQGFNHWLGELAPDVVCLQEVRAEPEQLSPACANPEGFHAVFNPCKVKKGYSGVATWSREAPQGVSLRLGVPEYDDEGRLIITAHAGVTIYNVYFPNGGRDLARVPFKLAFYETLMADLQTRLARGEGVVVLGDFNTARTELDLANPKANVGTTGFLPEERAVLERLIALGFHDVFREAHPDEKGHYTWWSNRPGVRARNIGWRIDYFLVSPALRGRVTDVRHQPEVLGSDHCPIVLDLDLP